MTLCEVFAREEGAAYPAPMTAPALILARIDALGAADVARRVAPAWGWSPRDAETRLSRYRAHVMSNGERGKDMSSTAFLALLAALGLSLTESTPCQIHHTGASQ